MTIPLAFATDEQPYIDALDFLARRVGLQIIGEACLPPEAIPL